MQLWIIEDRLREENQLPPAFAFWKWECFPKRHETIYVEFNGGECPLITRGKRKGKPNYRKSTNEKTFIVTVEQGKKWEADYEHRTGRCCACLGEAKVLKSLNCITGEKTYRS